MDSTPKPALSVVAAIVSDTVGPADTAHLEACLQALLGQNFTGKVEIIVPYHASVSGIGALRDRFPSVLFKECALRTFTGYGNREHHDELRARGLALARGEVVALIEDHGLPSPEWATRIMEAHTADFAAIGGAIENGIDRPLNWAVYFCDFLRYQNPLTGGESLIASDANVAYKRAALESIGNAWNGAFHETVVNQALRARGEKIGICPAAILLQHRLNLKLLDAVRERRVWGRSYGATRAASASHGRVALWILASPALPGLILARMTLMAVRKRRTLTSFLKALPLTALLVISWSLGEVIGYVSRKPNSSQPSPEIARASKAGS